MDTEQLKDFCAGLPGADSRLYEDPGNVLVYTIGGKRFAHFKTSEPERWRFSFKASAERFLELTDVPGIKPARWLGRYHWVSIVDARKMLEDYLRELVEWSYRHALGTLAKAKQAELAASKKAGDVGGAGRK
ncbi:MAG TPA: MmcQ/YjbR family DNA-binding protein [Pseudoxanthomonas sp.]